MIPSKAKTFPASRPPLDTHPHRQCEGVPIWGRVLDHWQQGRAGNRREPAVAIAGREGLLKPEGRWSIRGREQRWRGAGRPNQPGPCPTRTGPVGQSHRLPEAGPPVSRVLVAGNGRAGPRACPGSLDESVRAFSVGPGLVSGPSHHNLKAPSQPGPQQGLSRSPARSPPPSPS